MNEQMAKFRVLAQLLSDHGIDLILALVILITGLYFTKWITGHLKQGVQKYIQSQQVVSAVSNATGLLLGTFVLLAAAIEVGADASNVVVMIMIVELIAFGVFLLFRPLVPTLPFKVGHTVKAGDLLGVIEATTALNTRFRTFDGKTFFVPNKKIVDDIIINYHFTKSRRIKIDVTIGHDQDLAMAKRVLEAVMIGDSRILTKPSPQVYVLNLTLNGVEVGGRCWVNNKAFWVTRCELIEKTKFSFDRQGICFARHQLEVHPKGAAPAAK